MDDAALAALVGTRISPKPATQRPQMPYVVYQRISDAFPQTLPAPASTKRSRMQFDCWSETYGGAWNVASALITALDAAKELERDGACVTWCSFQDSGDLHDEDGAEHGVRVDFFIFHNEI